jgi:FAD synthase
MSKVCVDGAKVSISAMPPCVLVKIVDTIKGGSQSIVTSENKTVLLEKDFENWVKDFETPYISASFVIPGKLKGSSIKLSNLSTKTTIKGKSIVIQTTIGLMTLKVDQQAKMPTPAGPQPDPVPIYMAQVMITKPNQTTTSSI